MPPIRRKDPTTAPAENVRKEGDTSTGSQLTGGKTDYQLTEGKADQTPTIRLAVTTAMTSSAVGSGKDRYPFHVDAPPDVKLDCLNPTLRLAATAAMTTGYQEGAKARYPFHTEAAPSVRLAHVPGAQGDNVLMGRHGVERMRDTELPALLVSYYYLKKFLEYQHKYCYRNWVMDSGAFTAFQAGVDVKLQPYIDCCKERIAADPTLVEVFALDVIGDWKASLRNAEEMWRQGVPAIPCFHYGEPWDVLRGLAKDYPKIAVGGCVGRGQKDKFLEQCFARVWPCKIHGFGFGSEKSILGVPLHSADATNWEMDPCARGKWRAFGNSKVSVRGSKQNLRCEVLWYLELEEKARQQWKSEMELLESKFPSVNLSQYVYGTPSPATVGESPSVRLAESGANVGFVGKRGEQKRKALSGEV